jgi:uncharacterized protein
MAEARIEKLSLEECLGLLRSGSVGRIGVVVDEFPVVLPINYRLVETSGRTWVALRTRPGNVIEQASANVAFEIDGIDPAQKQGWSVLVRGTVHHVEAGTAYFRERWDSHPWLTAERDAWLIVSPVAITGRRVLSPASDWAVPDPAHL